MHRYADRRILTFDCSLQSVEDMERESIEFLKEHEPPEGYYLGFSGGKDSIVTKALCDKAGVKYTAFFSCTRIDPPEMYKFIRKEYPDVTWLYPKETFWEGCRKRSLPMYNRRWCCDVLKKDPAKNIPLKVRIMGIRAEESPRRAARGRIHDYKGHHVVLCPIFHWKEWHVWQYIEENGLKYPEIYDWGFSRIGCIVCPYILATSPSGMARLKRNMETWPKIWKVFHKFTIKYYEETKFKFNEVARFPDGEAFWQAYLKGFKKW